MIALIQSQLQEYLKKVMDEDKAYGQLLDKFFEILLWIDVPELKSKEQQKICTATKQVMLGLLYHVCDNGDLSEETTELRRKAEDAGEKLEALSHERERLKKSLDALNSDMSTLQMELEVLKEITKYRELREELKACIDCDTAYNDILQSAASRVPGQRQRLEDLARQTTALLTEQKQILRDSLKDEETAWAQIEEKIT